MSVNLIEIETQALQNDITKMTETVGTVQSKTDAMFETMAALDTMWDGQANEAFKAQFALDHLAMQELCSEVVNLISCMEFAKKTYEQCEEEVYQKIMALQMEGGN